MAASIVMQFNTVRVGYTEVDLLMAVRWQGAGRYYQSNTSRTFENTAFATERTSCHPHPHSPA